MIVMLGFSLPQGAKQGIVESNLSLLFCALIRFNFRLGIRRLGGVPCVPCSDLLLDWLRKFPFAGRLNLTLSERRIFGDRVATLFGGDDDRFSGGDDDLLVAGGDVRLGGGDPLVVGVGIPSMSISQAGKPSLFGSGGIFTCNYTGILTHIRLVDLPILINWTSPFPILGLSGVPFHSYSNFNKNSCKQTGETLITRRVLWRLIWVCTVCLCPNM